MTEGTFKHCPACRASVAEWRSHCDCGHEFFKPSKVESGGSDASGTVYDKWVIDKRGRKVRHVPIKKKKGKKDEPAPPPAVAETAETKVVVERVIERQVVVTRCKYCNEYTPVDASQCKGCGATL
jgi:hypothetical protein